MYWRTLVINWWAGGETPASIKRCDLICFLRQESSENKVIVSTSLRCLSPSCTGLPPASSHLIAASPGLPDMKAINVYLSRGNWEIVSGPRLSHHIIRPRWLTSSPASRTWSQTSSCIAPPSSHFSHLRAVSELMVDLMGEVGKDALGKVVCLHTY